MPTPPQVLFFDAAGTLFHLIRGVGWHYRDVASRHGWDLNEDALQHAFGAVWKEMPVRPATRQPRVGDDKDWWRALVERVLERCNLSAEIDAPARHAYFEELYAEFTRPGIWQLYPEVGEVLAALHPHFRLGLISNFDGRLRPILAHLGIGEHFFHPLVISSEVGADKPDPWIFQHALSRAGISAHEALHVGDDPIRDWQGAMAIGMRTFELHRPGNSLRDLLALLPGTSVARE